MSLPDGGSDVKPARAQDHQRHAFGVEAADDLQQVIIGMTTASLTLHFQNKVQAERKNVVAETAGRRGSLPGG